MLPVKALHDAFGLTRDGRHELPGRRRRGAEGHRRAGRAGRRCSPRTSTRCVTDGAAATRQVEHSVHANTLAFNVVPLLGTLGEEGYTDEEMKLRNESRKILEHPRPRASRRPACACRSWSATRSRSARRSSASVDLDEALAALARVPEPRRRRTPRRRWSGPAATRRPSAACAATSPTRHSLNFFVVGDNLLKGAALNTVQLAELLHERGLVRATARA